MPGNNFLSIKLKNSSLLIDLDFQDLISFVWLLIFSSPKTTLICPSLDLPVLIERNLFLAFSWNMLHKMIHIVHWFVCFHLDDNDIYGLFWFVLRFGIFLSIEHVSIHYLRWEAIAAAFFFCLRFALKIILEERDDPDFRYCSLSESTWEKYLNDSMIAGETLVGERGWSDWN